MALLRVDRVLFCAAIGAALVAPPPRARVRRWRAATSTGDDGDAWRAFWADLSSAPALRRSWRKGPRRFPGAAAAAGVGLARRDLDAALDADGTALADAARVGGAGGTWENAPLADAGAPSARLRASAADGTVLLNHGGVALPRLLGGACLGALDAFDLPVGVNVYASGPRLSDSAPVHTDRQEVFAVQCSGRKRWRVFAPPPVDDAPSRDPCARGKGGDVLDAAPLDVLFDGELEAGDVLYVPAGFPHATATGDQGSLHLTFGVLCNSGLGLGLGALRRLALPRGVYDALGDAALLRARDPSLYGLLETPLPLGAFLGGPSAGAGAFERACSLMLAAVAARPTPLLPAPEDPPPAADAAAAAGRVAAHHAALLAEMRRAYGGGGGGASAADRVEAHLDALGDLVDALYTPNLAALEARIAGATVVIR